MSQKPKYLIVISFDALSTLDFDTINQLPNFNEFISGSSFCRRVRSVYPSLTYPAHTSIITGRFPNNHGVINNTLLQPNRPSPDWFWYRKYIKGQTLYDAAVDEGLKVAALLWPVTGKSRIQYNMPEIFANRPYQNQILVSLLSGSPLYQFILNKRYGHLRKGLNEPELDNFVHQSVLYTINNYCPNLMLIHYTDLDSQRHMHGFNSPEASAALARHDLRLGEIIKTLKSKGIYEESAVILLGDHSSLDENKVIKLNVLLKKHGLITTDNKNQICDWQALAKSCDGSTYIYIKDMKDKNLFEAIKQILKAFAATPENGIEEIYTYFQAEKLGADKNCAFMLEAKKDYYFSDDAAGDIISDINPSDIGVKDHTTAATHGYSPYKIDYSTMFFASGKGIRPGIEIDEMCLVDEGPTMARLLGLKLENIDGKPIESILE